ncbi:slipin family protein [Roseateles saccharophilus]|uniref:SPFH domain/Band 7 family protein n=1 Tax=Roseateles saccharophilus TaxID=304 RepID=A0A4R3UYF5_ROSSA|nr:slipin family protein [Roseateles saccharophilus]MDG0831969.1 slipin family protein [Roseateles saccharophilus]TCU97365.1 SPFH domain/Band 7 family protein [Roseateles saccharophilus]
MTIKRVTVKKNERGLLLRNGDFERVLQPGTHWLFAGLDELKVEICNIGAPAFAHPLTDYLMAKEPEVVEAEFLRVELTEYQTGLRTENGVLVEVLPPATRRLYWRGLVDVQVQVIDLRAAAELPAAMAARLAQPQLRPRAVAGLAGVLQVEVPEHGTGLLRVDGKVERLLEPGAHAFWKFGRNVAVDLVDLRLQALEVTGQEILTRDKVALRLNLSATWRYTDVLRAFEQLAKPADHLYRELQFGLRAAVGTRTLDELLENKSVIDEVVTVQVTTKLQGLGLQLDGVGVKDIVLPGEMKTILAQVVEAGKAAEANVIRRREETAATRALLNTAKVMEDNPVALRLKELETLERVAERIDKISVFGGLDQVINGLVKLR